MSTPITPLKAPALADLLNALQLAVTYGDKEIPDAEAKQALGRIRGLIATALAKLGEPNEAALKAARALVGVEFAYFARGETVERKIRDIAAVILHSALTGEVAGELWTDTLPCPGCDGAGRIGTMPCEQCKGAGKL
jgi:hypothetical protein